MYGDTPETNDYLRSQLWLIAVWLQKTGFPYDWQSRHPAPASLRRELVDAWAEADDDDNYEAWNDTMKAEQTWTDTATAEGK